MLIQSTRSIENDSIPEPLKQSLRELLLSIADDKLILGQRNADWTGLAPILEEDIAFSSIAQDEIGHASALYEFVAGLEDRGRTADQLAFGRESTEYRCAELIVRDDGFDWAVALARQFFCDHLDMLRLERLSNSQHAPLAALARRLLAEERIHVGHADGWIPRLGRGGEESRNRVQTALNQVAPMTPTLFEPTPGIAELERSALYPPLAGSPAAPDAMFDSWRTSVIAVAERGGLILKIPEPDPTQFGGRRGRHSADFDDLLREMKEVSAPEPEAAW